jgi:hypothetical protein
MKTNKNKAIIIILILLGFQFSSYSQLKVTQNGNVGIGKIPTTKLDVNGDVSLYGYVGINGPVPVGYPLSVKSAYNQIISIDPSLSESNIGSSTDKINFWYSSSTGHHRLYASSYNTTSDSTLKKNIIKLSDGALGIILKMRPVSFDFKNDSLELRNSKLKHLGLIAQEVELLLPEVISFSEVGKVKTIDYDMITPVLIKAIQEQQVLIESLQSELKKIKTESSKSTTSSSSNQNDIYSNAILMQNAPNPFSSNTIIRYYLPEKIQVAFINIYDLNGNQIKSNKITQNGWGNITIYGSELNPGMYLYSLICDSHEIDTKRMIILE